MLTDDDKAVMNEAITRIQSALSDDMTKKFGMIIIMVNERGMVHTDTSVPLQLQIFAMLELIKHLQELMEGQDGTTTH